MKKSLFGTLYDGRKVYLWTIENGNATFSVTNYGASITSLVIKGKNYGKSGTDVVLGYPTFTGYANNLSSRGAIIGRYSNRISGAKFSLDGKIYKLTDNERGICLHGGNPRWEHTLWNGKFIKTKNASGIEFTKTFPDGHQGFPGTLDVSVKYLIETETGAVNNKTTLSMIYTARTDKKTPISITNHSYFNLLGSGSVENHILTLFPDKVLEKEKNLIPTGKILSVEGTPYDFQKGKKIGVAIKELNGIYDDCFVTKAFSKDSAIPTRNTPIVCVAELFEESENRKMSVFSNNEGVQIYTEPCKTAFIGKNGIAYYENPSICFETQNFPDSPNKNEFPSTILNPTDEYYSITKYVFE